MGWIPKFYPVLSSEVSPYHILCILNLDSFYNEDRILWVITQSIIIIVFVDRDINQCNNDQERALQNVTNLFIVSLAVADLCVAGVVMPFYAYTMVSDGDDDDGYDYDYD